jgi:HPt (histidine-containing phosphotransfer) domain-containing protein
MVMSQLLDIDTLSTLKEVVGDDLKEIIDSFLQLLPGQLDAIETSARAGDAANLRLHAHTLKGSAANVGAAKLSEISYTVESLAKSGETSKASAQMSRMTAINTADALRRFMV